MGPGAREVDGGKAGGKPGGGMSVTGKATNVPTGREVVAATGPGPGPSQKAVVPAGEGPIRQAGYFRKLKPAENYDVVSFARAMNDDFAPRLQKLFDPEVQAAKAAIETGVYVGWRCPEFKHDCQRAGIQSRCFCGHTLMEHDPFNAKSARVKCAQGGCVCKAFAWMPARPEDIGEFWLQKRPTFDVTTWRAKCRCKHTHEQHRADSYKCGVGGCGCFRFDSNFLCAACDKHWEQHATFFESTAERRANGLPTGEDYLPFAEIPQLRDIALTGEEASKEGYAAITTFFGPSNDNIPRGPTPRAIAGGPPMIRGPGRGGGQFGGGGGGQFGGGGGGQFGGGGGQFAGGGGGQFGGGFPPGGAFPHGQGGFPPDAAPPMINAPPGNDPYGGNAQYGRNNPQCGGNSPFGQDIAQFDGNDMSFGGNNPQFGGNNPQFGGNNPQFGGNNAQFGGNNPQFGGNNPQFGGNNPQFGGNNSQFGGNSPGNNAQFGGPRPGRGGAFRLQY